jgi:hypothetical protein
MQHGLYFLLQLLHDREKLGVVRHGRDERRFVDDYAAKQVRTASCESEHSRCAERVAGHMGRRTIECFQQRGEIVLVLTSGPGPEPVAAPLELAVGNIPRSSSSG